MGQTYTLSGDFSDLLGDEVDTGKISAYVRTNLPAGTALIDTTATADSIRLGNGKITVATDGTFSITLLGTANTGLNVAANTLRYEVVAEYVDRASRGRSTWRSGFFELTANSDLKTLATAVEPIAAVSASGYALEAKGYRDEAAAITGLTGEDAAIANRINTPGSLTDQALTAMFARKGEAGTTLTYVNTYDGFFAGKTSATDTTLPTIWSNSTHLTNTGLRAWADYIVAQMDAAGVLPDTGKVVWFGDSWIDQGEASILSAATLAVAPGVTVVASGTGGNTSQNLLDRFATDVPTDADVVIFNEPGVNDAAGGITVATQLDNLTALTRKIIDLGALPVFTGHVPLTDYTHAATSHTRLKAIIGTGRDFLGAVGSSIIGVNVNRPASSQKDSIGLNPTALAATGAFTPGNSNTAGGFNAAKAMTTGRGSTAFGAYAMQTATTSVESTAFGSYALAAQTTGNYNTAFGANAGRGITTGTQNVLIGPDAGYKGSDGVTTNAIADGNENVLIGDWAMSTSGSGSGATGVGAQVKVAPNATALGRATQATASGSVAIGRDGAGVSAVSTLANYFVLGTTNHIVQVQGYLRIDRKQTTVGAAGAAAALPATPSRYFIIRGDDSVDYVVPAYAKA